MKSRVLLLLHLLLLLGIVWWPFYAQADELSQRDVSAIQGAVQSQIDALAKDDADSAFALTSDDTRNRLGSPDNFLRLIKEQYDPLYRHQLALFSKPIVVKGKTFLSVRFTDMESHVWVAIYLMSRDEEGAWRIDGCQLLETTAVSV